MSRPLRVLIVEDSEDDALLMMRTLRRGGYDPEFERVDTATAMNTALDELRRRRRRARTASLDEIRPAMPDRTQEAVEASEVVSLALAALPERQRAAVVLRDIEGLDTDEAAAALGITPSGLRSILAEGRLRFKEVIEKRFPEFTDWDG